MSTTKQAPWDRLRAVLDAWRAPEGLTLYYHLDARIGRLALNVTAACGGTEAWDISRLATAASIERAIAYLPAFLDLAAHEVLRRHICCCGRLPRAVSRAGRHFDRWADEYPSLDRSTTPGARPRRW